jgi:arabinose-5-phosphate isomerase
MMKFTDNQTLINYGLQVLEIETACLSQISRNLNESFAEACRTILECKGRVIVIGIGKSGHVGRKIAATLASTGSPAFFVHPAEAMHGDLGMITKDDVAILLSKSGEAHEIISFLPLLKRLGIKLINITGNLNSTLAKLSDINLDASVDREACSLNLAPTASTTATMALGDALAISVLQARGFTEEDFARSHPGGMLGRRLLIRISDIMQTGDKLPRVTIGTKLADAIIEISQKCLGMTTIVNPNDHNDVIGVCTDGDLRRAFSRSVDLHTTLVEDIMTKSFKVAYADMLATEAVMLMQKHKITALPVLDRDEKLIGALNIHDVFKAGVV